MQQQIEERDANGIIVMLMLMLIIFGGLGVGAVLGAMQMHKAFTTEAHSTEPLAKSELTKAEIKQLNIMPPKAEKRHAGK